MGAFRCFGGWVLLAVLGFRVLLGVLGFRFGRF